MKDRKKTLHIHSNVSDKQPKPEALEFGELGVNNAAGNAFISTKNSNGEVVRFSEDETLIGWMEMKEVFPYSGYVRGSDGEPDVTESDLLNNRSNIVFKLNQVVPSASTTEGYGPYDTLVNGAKDIYGIDVNPVTYNYDDENPYPIKDGAGFSVDMSRYAMIDANPSFSSVTVSCRTEMNGTTEVKGTDGPCGSYFGVDVENICELASDVATIFGGEETVIGANCDRTLSSNTTDIRGNEIIMASSGNIGISAYENILESSEQDIYITADSDICESAGDTASFGGRSKTNIGYTCNGESTSMLDERGENITVYANDTLCESGNTVTVFASGNGARLRIGGSSCVGDNNSDEYSEITYVRKPDESECGIKSETVDEALHEVFDRSKVYLRSETPAEGETASYSLIQDSGNTGCERVLGRFGIPKVENCDEPLTVEYGDVSDKWSDDEHVVENPYTPCEGGRIKIPACVGDLKRTTLNVTYGDVRQYNEEGDDSFTYDPGDCVQQYELLRVPSCVSHMNRTRLSIIDDDDEQKFYYDPGKDGYACSNDDEELKIYGMVLSGDTNSISYKPLEENQPMKMGTLKFVGCDGEEIGTYNPVDNDEETINIRNKHSKLTFKYGGDVTNVTCPIGYNPDSINDSRNSVDFGLPSGTLWADMNVGANSPYEYGSYYAFGSGFYDVYCNDTHYTGSDTTVPAEFDTATQNWGEKWMLPTKEQFTELIQNTIQSRVVRNGVTGVTFSRSGKSIFIPLGGTVFDTNGNPTDVGSIGCIWSSSQDRNGQYCMTMLSDGRISVTSNDAANGFSVRPVINPNVSGCVTTTEVITIPQCVGDLNRRKIKFVNGCEDLDSGKIYDPGECDDNEPIEVKIPNGTFSFYSNGTLLTKVGLCGDNEIDIPAATIVPTPDWPNQPLEIYQGSPCKSSASTENVKIYSASASQTIYIPYYSNDLYYNGLSFMSGNTAIKTYYPGNYDCYSGETKLNVYDFNVIVHDCSGGDIKSVKYNPLSGNKDLELFPKKLTVNTKYVDDEVGVYTEEMGSYCPFGQDSHIDISAHTLTIGSEKYNPFSWDTSIDAKKFRINIRGCDGDPLYWREYNPFVKDEVLDISADALVVRTVAVSGSSTAATYENSYCPFEGYTDMDISAHTLTITANGCNGNKKEYAFNPFSADTNIELDLTGCGGGGGDFDCDMLRKIHIVHSTRTEGKKCGGTPNEVGSTNCVGTNCSGTTFKNACEWYSCPANKDYYPCISGGNDTFDLYIPTTIEDISNGLITTDCFVGDCDVNVNCMCNTGCVIVTTGLCVSGSVVAESFFASSDKRLKENISNLSKDDIRKADNVKLKSFNFKDDESKTKTYGVIAQDVQDAGLGNIVHSDKEGMLSVDYTSLLLLKIASMEDTIKELTNRIDILSNRLNFGK